MLMRKSLLITALFSSLGLTGCSSWFEGSNAAVPTPLVKINQIQAVSAKWTVNQSVSGSSFLPAYANGNIVSADSEGHIRTIDVFSGHVVSEVNLKQALSAGVAVSGNTAVVATVDGRLLAIDTATGKEQWSQALTSIAIEAPQVGGKAVFIHTNDGRITSFSITDGKQIWSVSRSLPQLIVQNTGSMQAVGQEALMVGQAGGKLAILNQANGSSLWEGAVATPRGATELERVTDVASRPVYMDGQVCAVAYQGRVVCFDAKTGSLNWAHELSSSKGLAIDAKSVYVTGEDGAIWAFDRSTGKSLWKNDDLKNRGVSGPALLGRFVMVTDDQGYVHLLSNESGSIVGRTKINTEGATAQPVSLGSTALVQGANGRLIMLSLG